MNVLFYFNDTATTEIYTLSLHDALPIFFAAMLGTNTPARLDWLLRGTVADRKSTRLNSSHMSSSYAVFCLKKKKCIISGFYVFLIINITLIFFILNYIS